MKNRIAQLVVALSILLAPTFLFMNSSHAATLNFGACIRSAGPDLAHYQAPGQTGNGPVSQAQPGDVLNVPNAFAGGVACTN